MKTLKREQQPHQHLPYMVNICRTLERPGDKNMNQEKKMELIPHETGQKQLYSFVHTLSNKASSGSSFPRSSRSFLPYKYSEASCFLLHLFFLHCFLRLFPLAASPMALYKAFLGTLFLALVMLNLVDALQAMNDLQTIDGIFASSPMPNTFASSPSPDTFASSPMPIDCDSECTRRCQLASRHKICMRACKSCCVICNCVPPGTSGNKEQCPCYDNLTTHGGRKKCP
ncbi:hypothetical protein HPP92_000434 [Vanilla planifolia]|uniref:Uncharacterized protein n=1 Tax=Vanilla planifolia TaxID=51239 RepID=A0A835VIQ9_VANPL|nr:hypothetical protein HPP92_000434 [Vanilla planifolia]